MEAMTQMALFISFLVSLARLHKSYDIWQEVIDFILSLSVAPELFGQPGFKFITWLKRSHGWAKRWLSQEKGLNEAEERMSLKWNKLETFEDALWKQEKLQHVKLKTLHTWLIPTRKAECGKPVNL